MLYGILFDIDFQTMIPCRNARWYNAIYTSKAE